MMKNPYKFIGPLDPVEDKIVCMPRAKEKFKVISGVMNGDYWTILGPRQIGKTTFLRQLMSELSTFHCIYINFEVSPKTDEKFYKWIIERIVESIEADSSVKETEKWKNFGPELHFLNFLEKFLPKENKKIVFFFDDMEKAHCVRSFLHLWRKVFHERYHRPELKKYAVITTGKVDLSSLTMGETSPFNIARKLELTNLNETESDKLVTDPFKRNHIILEPGTKETLLSQAAGHPQLLQHLCHMLIEQALEGNKCVTPDDVDNAIKRVFIENDNLKALEKEIKTNKILENLSRQILEGEEKDYIPYRDLSITGTGPIIPKGHRCAIRNKIYERMIGNLIGESVSSYLPSAPAEKIGYTVYISLSELPKEFDSVEKEKQFLKRLFDVTVTRVWIKKGNMPLQELDLNYTEKLVFCYLSYRNYKATRAGHSPSMRNYLFSSVPKNNSKQEPEWSVVVDAVNAGGYLSKNSAEPDGTIRVAIFSTRKKLRGIGCEGVVPKQKPGGGEGYWLKGDVVFNTN